jgi:hypothetical protein
MPILFGVKARLDTPENVHTGKQGLLCFIARFDTQQEYTIVLRFDIEIDG